MEKLLNKQVLKYLIQNNLLYNLQSGFLPHHSTITQLAFLVHTWQMCLDQGEVVHAAFLDLSKAYDRVWIDGLLYKMTQMGFLPPALQWFTSFLTERKQRVRVGEIHSSWQTPKSGIPQGTVLGPVLFLIFINDLPKMLGTKPTIFADDSTIYATGLNHVATAAKLTVELTEAKSWADNWGMEFNPGKSEHLIIHKPRRGSPQKNANIFMSADIVPAVSQHKHLGIRINKTLTWNDHIAATRTKCAQRIGMLRRLSQVLPKATVSAIYTATIRPIMEYGCQIWGGGNTTSLQRLQDKFCRTHRVSLPKVQQRIDYHTLILFFQIRNYSAPTYLQSLTPATFSSSVRYDLRKDNYPLPTTNLAMTLKSFFPRALMLWNNLPSYIQSKKSVSQFKLKLREHIFR